jgi:hypothetical protein
MVLENPYPLKIIEKRRVPALHLPTVPKTYQTKSGS